jgi:hypothetical protein
MPILFGLALGTAQGQQPAPPKAQPSDQSQKSADAQMMALMAPMARITEAMLDAQLSVAAKPETAERIAVFKKNLYESLLKKGFSQDQAVAIVVATPIPSGAGIGK